MKVLSNLKFYNIKKFLDYLKLLKTRKSEDVSVFVSLKRMFIFFLLYVIVTILAAMIVIFSLNKNVKVVEMPKVVNMDFYKAYPLLHSRGLNVNVELKYFDNIEAGKVVSQSVEPLKKIKEKRTVNLVVSLGAQKSEKKEEEYEPQLWSYVLNFKLPENYDNAFVKIVVDDEKIKNNVVFQDVITKTNLIKLPLKLYGKAIQKIYINDQLYIEKEIEK